MRFLMLMIPKVYQHDVEPGFTPPADAVEKMMAYNEQLAKAGVLLSLDGLHPPVNGARVSFKGGKPAVKDGPFAEAKEVVGGFWMLQCKSREEAIEWARRIPAADGDVVEIRQVFEMTDYPDDVQKAADNKAVRDAIRR